MGQGLLTMDSARRDIIIGIAVWQIVCAFNDGDDPRMRIFPESLEEDAADAVCLSMGALS